MNPKWYKIIVTKKDGTIEEIDKIDISVMPFDVDDGIHYIKDGEEKILPRSKNIEKTEIMVLSVCGDPNCTDPDCIEYRNWIKDNKTGKGTMKLCSNKCYKST